MQKTERNTITKSRNPIITYLCQVKFNKGNRKPKNFFQKKESRAKKQLKTEVPTWPMRLNRYLSQSGVCSRRNARTHIEAGEVQVNGEVILEMGHRVNETDEVLFNNEKISPRQKTYILLNKPKNTITTTSDPQGRKTVMDCLGPDGKHLYPVGRLDRLTTGLLLFTNDGDLAQKLAHPSYEVEKLYAVETDKPVSPRDIEHLMYGVELEEGTAKADAAAYIEGKTKHHVGIKIHFGWNRVVRRMFKALGYEVVKLDRTMYAGLTKMNVPRGKFRYLKEEEVRRLKYFNKFGEK